MPEVHFRNVDLEVTSRARLDRLVEAFPDRAYLLSQWQKQGVHHAAFEMDDRAADPEELVRVFCDLVESLPDDARQVWDACSDRVADIGIHSGDVGNYYASKLQPATLARLAELGIGVAVSVYPLFNDE